MTKAPFLAALAALVTAACSSVVPGQSVVKSDRNITGHTFSDCQPRPDSPPRLVTGKSPIYPIHRMLAKEEGYTIIAFDITAKGNAENFEMIESSNSVFYTHTRVAVSDWQFEPATVKGEPVTVRCQFRQSFVVG